MQEAVSLSTRCPPSEQAYSVGALLVSADGMLIASGYSREHSYKHAEEIAIEKALAQGADLSSATLYSTMEPCSTRHADSIPCTTHILESRIPRVCYALPEPLVFVQCIGARLLRDAGVDVVEMPEWADTVRTVNSHLLSPSS